MVAAVGSSVLFSHVISNWQRHINTGFSKLSYWGLLFEKTAARNRVKRTLNGSFPFHISLKLLTDLLWQGASAVETISTRVDCMITQSAILSLYEGSWTELRVDVAIPFVVLPCFRIARASTAEDWWCLSWCVLVLVSWHFKIRLQPEYEKENLFLNPTPRLFSS